MSRLLVVIAALVFGLGFVGLLWIGNSFSGLDSNPELSLGAIAPQQVAMGQPLTMDVAGSGLDDEVLVSLHMDVNNRTAEIGSVPIDGALYDLELVDDVLFVAGHSAGIVRIDVSVPDVPRLIPSRVLNNQKVVDIERSGDRLFLSCGDQGLKTARVLSGGRFADWQALSIPGNAFASKKIGRYLYVASGKSGLLIYDLSENNLVARIAEFGPVLGLEAFENHLFLRTMKEVTVLNTSRSVAPEVVCRIAVEDAPRAALSIANKQLYVMENRRISQYALDDPANPVPVSKREYFNSPQRLLASGNRLYVPAGSGLGVVEKEASFLPSQAAFLSLGGNSRAVVQVGRLLYVAVSEVGIKVIDPDRMLPRETVGQITVPQAVSDFVIVDDQLYVANRSSELYFRSLSDSSSEPLPLKSGLFQVGSLVYRKPFLYAVGMRKGIAVFDVSRTAAPQLVSSHPDLEAMNIAVDDGYLLAARSESGLALMKLQADGEMKVVDGVPTPDTVKVWTGGGLFYATGVDGAVRIYRRNEDRLLLLSQFQLPFPLNRFVEVLDLRAVDGTLYVANGRGGLLVVDIHDPKRPTLHGSLELPGYANSLSVVGDRCYVASRLSGLHTVDISNKRKPRLMNSIAISDLEGGVAFHRGLLYIGNWYMGITVIPEPQLLPKVDVVSEEHLRVNIPSPHFPGRYSLQFRRNGDVVTRQGVVRYQ